MKRTAFAGLSALLAAAVLTAGCTKGDAAQAGSGKPVAIKVEVFDRGTDGGKSDPANNNWTDWIKKKVLEDENIAVTFVPVNRWDETSAMNNLLAAGTAPDVCFSYNTDMINGYGLQGGVYDLAPYVDTRLKDVKTLLGPDPQVRGQDLIWRNKNADNGALYSISNRYMYTANQNLFIRKDWLDKLGLPLPATSEEYFNTLRAFKEQDPGGVGKDRVIPFTLTTDVRWTAGLIINSFIDPFISSQERWINTVGDRFIMVPGFKEGIRFLNRMYNAGLVDRDFPLYKSDDIMLNLIKSGVVGSIAGNWDTVYRDNNRLMLDLQQNVPGALFTPVDCFLSADGIPHKLAGALAGGMSFFVPKTSKNIEAALRYVNWLAKKENCFFLQFGEEGINHQMADGVPKPIPAAGGWIQNSGGNIDYTISVNGWVMDTPELIAKVLSYSYQWPQEYITEAYRIASNGAEPGPVVPATLLKWAPLAQTLNDKATVVYVNGVTAKPEEFDKVWNDGVRDWLASGAQEVIDERREKYRAP